MGVSGGNGISVFVFVSNIHSLYLSFFDLEHMRRVRNDDALRTDDDLGTGDRGKRAWGGFYALASSLGYMYVCSFPSAWLLQVCLSFSFVSMLSEIFMIAKWLPYSRVRQARTL